MVRRFPFAITAVVAIIGCGITWITARALAADGRPSDEQIRSVAKTIHADRAATRERLARLQSIREALKASNADSATLVELDVLIESERRAREERGLEIRELVLRDRGDADEFNAVVERELGYLSEAIDRLDQSYEFNGVRGHTSSTAGSRFNDPEERPEEIRLEDEEEERIAELEERIEALSAELASVRESRDAG